MISENTEFSSVFDVADYFIANADPDEGITNLKLQKLCSYAQAFFLALHGHRFFASALEAWPHGPVIKGLYIGQALHKSFAHIIFHG